MDVLNYIEPEPPTMEELVREQLKPSNFPQLGSSKELEHNNSENIEERTQLYVDYIQPAFHEMVEKIVYTYKFTNLPNIDPLKEECKVWLTTILAKYDPNKGSKAFSYFSVITKNWFIH